ncbi:MAG TPA: YHYH domain-containing protein [Thermoanaerobaculia bacterium]
MATIVLAVLVLSPSAAGHGGGLDRNGCHTNRKTGEYHCHAEHRRPPRHQPHEAPLPPFVLHRQNG